eukprot:GHVR01093827.1.p1 GENE.GHVR01093827.1~~GHVR01093827.1.p1  ORF type:complete len:322 (+),score=129.74 GHVR01093827.1:140-1105(+)
MNECVVFCPDKVCLVQDYVPKIIKNNENKRHNSTSDIDSLLTDEPIREPISFRSTRPKSISHINEKILSEGIEDESEYAPYASLLQNTHTHTQHKKIKKPFLKSQSMRDVTQNTTEIQKNKKNMRLQTESYLYIDSDSDNEELASALKRAVTLGGCLALYADTSSDEDNNNNNNSDDYNSDNNTNYYDREMFKYDIIKVLQPCIDISPESYRKTYKYYKDRDKSRNLYKYNDNIYQKNQHIHEKISSDVPNKHQPVRGLSRALSFQRRQKDGHTHSASGTSSFLGNKLVSNSVELKDIKHTHTHTSVGIKTHTHTHTHRNR